MTPLRRTQSGLATLVAVMILLFGAALLSVYAQRHEVTERRMAQLDAEWTQAQAAAESGLAAAQSLLNREASWTGCTDTFMSTRERWLTPHGTKGWTLREQDGPALQCELDDSGRWHCRCPGAAEDEAPASATLARASHRVWLSETESGLRLRAQGCARPLQDCGEQSDPSDPGAQARGQAQVDLRWASALPRLPGAALTVRGGLRLTQGATAQVPTAAGGFIRAGSVAEVESGSVSGPPGSPGQELLEEDPLGALSTVDAFLLPWFGAAPERHRDHMVASPVNCTDNCDAQIRERLDRGERLIWIRGGAEWRLPQSMGSPQRPVMVVVEGPLSIRAAIRFYGVLVALSGGDWLASGGLLTGSLLSAGDWSVSGPATLELDPVLAQRVQRELGRYVRRVASQGELL